MCDPVTAGVMGAGALLSAKGAHDQASAQKDSLRYQQKVAQNNAILNNQRAADALGRGKQAVQDNMRKVAGLKGAQNARLAASGVDMGEGSALALLEDTHYFGELDNRRIYNNAEREAWGAQVGAMNDGASALLMKNSAKGISANKSAGVSLLGGAGSAASTWASYNKGG